MKVHVIVPRTVAPPRGAMWAAAAMARLLLAVQRAVRAHQQRAA